MKLSFVVLTYNNQTELFYTLNSIRDNLPKNYEIIIINGGESVDLSEMIELNIKHINEADNGIYDAMNKALNYCDGEFVMFMNSGDRLINKLPSIFNKNLTLFDAIERTTDGTEFYKTCRPISYIRTGMPTHHQAMIFDFSIIKKFEIEFKTKYSVAADYEFLLKFIQKCQSIEIIHQPVCYFIKGGTSYQKRYLGNYQQFKIRKAYYGITAAVYHYLRNTALLVLRDVSPKLFSTLRYLYARYL